MRIAQLIVSFIFIASNCFSQGQVSGFHAGKGHLNFATYFNYEQYNTFYRGQNKIELPSMLDRMTVISSGIFAEYGLTNKIDVSVNLPFISSSATSIDAPSAQSGLQDLALCIKYSPLQLEHFNLMLAGGLSLPTQSYVTDAPVAIGHGSTNYDARVIAQYRWDNGLFISGQMGHTYQTTIVPNTYSSGIRVGYALSNAYFHVWLENQRATSGTDIGDGPFPSNRINFTKTGFIFVKPITSIIQLSLGSTYILNGRNIGKAWSINGGLIFKLTPSTAQKKKEEQKAINSNKAWRQKALHYKI